MSLNFFFKEVECFKSLTRLVFLDIENSIDRAKRLLKLQPMQPPSFGIMTLAFGHEHYMRQAEALAFSVKLHMPGIRVALISDSAQHHCIFDDHGRIDPTHGLGAIQKLWIDQYSPYDHTLFIDSDSLVTRPFHQELLEMNAFEFSPCGALFYGLEDSDNFYFENLGQTLRMIGVTEIPRFNGGVYFFKKGDMVKRIFEEARNVAKDAKRLGLKDFDKGGVGDEPALSLALAKLGVRSFCHNYGRLMQAPLDITGPVQIDVLKGFSYMADGVLRTPAICHFAAPYSRYWPYYYNCFLARHPRCPAFLKELIKLYFRVARSHRLRRLASLRSPVPLSP